MVVNNAGDNRSASSVTEAAASTRTPITVSAWRRKREPARRVSAATRQRTVGRYTDALVQVTASVGRKPAISAAVRV
jgi:hypothetical protein